MQLPLQTVPFAGAAVRGVTFQATMATGVTACTALGWSSLRVLEHLRPCSSVAPHCDHLPGLRPMLAAAGVGAVALNAVPSVLAVLSPPVPSPIDLEAAATYLFSSSFEAPFAALAGAVILQADANAAVNVAGVGCLVLLSTTLGLCLVGAALAGAYDNRAYLCGGCLGDAPDLEAGGPVGAGAPTLRRESSPTLQSPAPALRSSGGPPPYVAPPSESTPLLAPAAKGAD